MANTKIYNSWNLILILLFYYYIYKFEIFKNLLEFVLYYYKLDSINKL